MGITNNAEEFLLRILNFEIVFEFAEKTDYLFLYKIKECIKHSECPEGAYLPKWQIIWICLCLQHQK